MTFIELPEPIPRDRPLGMVVTKHHVSAREFLDIPDEPAAVTFWDVIASRHSRRQFGKLDRSLLGRLLWHAIKTRETSKPTSEVRWQSRPYPSAGGVHAIDLLVVEQSAIESRFSWYNPISHSLDTSGDSTPGGADKLLAAANDIIPLGGGTVLWFVANVGMTNAMYSNPESLVWRDSGALLMTVYLVAEALGLACCGLGATGTQNIRAILRLDDEYIGVGGCVVGSRVPGIST